MKRRTQLWLTTSAIVLALILGAGFQKTLSARGNTETYKGLKVFSDVIEEIEANYVDDVDSKELIQKAIEGMVGSLDPHSTLLPPEAFEELQVDTKGEFGGIGIVITMKDGRLTVISPIEGTPAFKAGIKAEDIVVKVDDKITKDMALWEAVKLMRGPKGKGVKITVARKGEKEFLEFDLIRDTIPITSVRYTELQSGYGYVWVTNFRENTESELKDALKELQKKAALKGLVLDLRGNPGGLLDQAIAVSDLFLSNGPIVSIRGRTDDSQKVYTASRLGTQANYPVVILINEGTASASEIVAGALQDQQRAVILGTASFGKGSVQTVRPLKDGYALKYTIARYYTPSGRSIQAQGIQPDLEVAYRPFEDKEEENSPILKEKDLEGHLEAELPELEKGNEAEKKAEGTTDNNLLLDAERLKKDNQIQRALDILVGYAIISRN